MEKHIARFLFLNELTVEYHAVLLHALTIFLVIQVFQTRECLGEDGFDFEEAGNVRWHIVNAIQTERNFLYS